jgi:sec-independent protein translocase protein TatC
MTILEHLEELRQRLFKILWTLLPLFIFYVTFTIRFVEYQGLPIPYPWPDFYGSLSTLIVRRLMDDLLPVYVERVQLHPGEAIIVQFKVALFMAVLTAMPMIVYQLSKFVSPGLYERERRIIAKITIPASLLFLMGVLFSYLWILPFAFDFLYGVGLRMGLTPFVGPDQFFDVVLLFFVGIGLAFQTPIIMWGLTALEVIDPSVWKKYWRVALVAFFVFGAAITPDGSGITMLLVAAPMSVLYAIGYVLAERTWTEKRGLRPKAERARPRLAVWSVVVLFILAIAGGLVYYNLPLFLPPVEASEASLVNGTAELDLPAFVIYSPRPFGSGVRSGATLRAAAETNLTFTWSAVSSTGLEVLVSPVSEVDGPISASPGNFTMAVYPARWTSGDVRSLTLTATDGEAGVYVLHLRVDYEIVLRTEFSDANRNGVLDGGEEIRSEVLVFRYTPTPTSADLMPLPEAGIGLPLQDQRLLVEKGVFASIGPGWRLSASVWGMGAGNMSFNHTLQALEVDAGGHAVSLSLTRLFRWTPTADLEIWVEGDVATEFLYMWYMDLRFGTIYPVVQLT